MPRQERFANLIAQGKKTATAYREAGYKPNSKSAKKLATSVVIRERVFELQQLAVSETTLTVKKVLDELQKIGFANMMDYVTVDAEGQPVLDFTALDREKAAAIGEITTDTITNPRTGEITRRTKFKLLDKKGTLVDLGRYLGMFVNRTEVKTAGVVFHVNSDDMAL
jgi:phage terminase small subunit